MRDHGGKENRVKPWERAFEPGYQSPAHCKKEITGVMDLTSQAIPPIYEERVSCISLYSLGILQCLPRELRESLSGHKSPAFLVTKFILLAVRRVPDPVHKEV